MIIKRNDTNTIEFGQLHSGDVFIEEVEGVAFVQMKIDSFTTEDDDRFNAVYLESGELDYVDHYTKVRKVDAELIIK